MAGEKQRCQNNKLGMPMHPFYEKYSKLAFQNSVISNRSTLLYKKNVWILTKEDDIIQAQRNDVEEQFMLCKELPQKNL